MPNVPYHYEVNSKLVTGNGSLTPISSLSNRSLSPSLTVLVHFLSESYQNRTCIAFRICVRSTLSNKYVECVEISHGRVFSEASSFTMNEAKKLLSH